MKRVKSGKGPAGAEEDAGDAAQQDLADAEDSPAKALVSLKEGLSGTWNEKFNSPQKTPNWKSSGNPGSEMPFRSSKRSRLFCEEEERPMNTRSPKRNPKSPATPQKAVVALNTPVKKSSQKIGYRLRNLLKLPKAHKWCIYEWFYSNIDKPLFEGDNDFCVCLKESFPNLKTRKLTRVEWGKIRRLMGKPRRCSAAFFEEERAALEQKRQKIRLLQQRKVADVSQFKDLPDEIPLSLVIGTKVTARLRGQHDGLFTGQIDAVDTQNSTYRVTFDRNGLGTHTIPDYEVLSYEPHETMPIAAFGQKQRPSRSFMTPPRSNYPPSVLSPITGTDPFLGQSPWKNKMSSADNNDTIGGFPVEFLDQVMSPKTGTSESRNPPFTEAENEALARKVLENYSKLYGNRSAMISAHNRKEIWKSIARHVTAAGTTRRTPEKCKKRYSDLKIKVKNKMANKIRHRRRKGGQQPLNTTYTTSESLMRKIITLSTVKEDPNEADAISESGKQTEATGEPQNFNNASVDSPVSPNVPVKSETRQALKTSPTHTPSASSTTDDMSQGTGGNHKATLQGPSACDGNRDEARPSGQNCDFNVKLLENVRVCNTQLFSLMRAVTDLKDQVQTTNNFLGQIAQSLRNIHSTLRERKTARRQARPTQPSTSGACNTPTVSQSEPAGEPIKSVPHVNQKEAPAPRTAARGTKRARKPRPKPSAQANATVGQREKSKLRSRKRPRLIATSRPSPQKK
uniref:Lin-9 DREAM MuvB core complex component n=1 Tax=Leptobrachium leishanense TaxID=445787 RepID=A0A8C5PMG4_9ANUR